MSEQFPQDPYAEAVSVGHSENSPLKNHSDPEEWHTNPAEPCPDKQCSSGALSVHQGKAI